MTVTVQLDIDEVDELYLYALEKRDWFDANWDYSTGRTKYDRLIYEMAGRAGEYAVAKYLHVPFIKNIEGDLDGDVAGYQVKTATCHAYNLMTHDQSPRGVYIFATCEHPSEVRLHGWIALMDTLDASRKRHDLPRAPYVTPKKYLRPMDTLPALARHRS